LFSCKEWNKGCPQIARATEDLNWPGRMLRQPSAATVTIAAIH
jgi:hypothetical protein